jgi:hypothetical protein
VVSFLWLNFIGAMMTIIVGYIFQMIHNATRGNEGKKVLTE